MSADNSAHVAVDSPDATERSESYWQVQQLHEGSWMPADYAMWRNEGRPLAFEQARTAALALANKARCSARVVCITEAVRIEPYFVAVHRSTVEPVFIRGDVGDGETG